MKAQQLSEKIGTYITINSNDTDKESNIKEKIDSFKVSKSAIDEYAADNTKNTETTEGNCKVSTSDNEFDCNIVIVKNSIEQFT